MTVNAGSATGASGAAASPLMKSYPQFTQTRFGTGNAALTPCSACIA
ncbi:MAG: hypothetical protein QM659_11465 [Rhodomicrobium sp.]